MITIVVVVEMVKITTATEMVIVREVHLMCIPNKTQSIIERIHKRNFMSINIDIIRQRIH